MKWQLPQWPTIGLLGLFDVKSMSYASNNTIIW
jgi:hypothetical protein